MIGDVIGKPIDRKDARLKVTGAAKYAAEFNQPKMAYAFPVRSTIGKGAITAIDTSAAEKAGGVVKIFTHENAPRFKEINPQEMRKTGGFLGEQLLPIQDNKVHYYGQYIALAVAETYEQARAAAGLVKVTYKQETPATDLEKELAGDFKSKGGFVPERAQTNEGNAANAIKSAFVKIEQTYTTPTENHHPMEPHATVAVWQGADKLTIYDATQGVKAAQGTAAYFFDLKPDNVQVISPFVGGGFGCKGAQWAHILLAAMAAKNLNRPVKFVLTRQMMTTNVGRRADTIQKVALAADKSGKLSAIRHHSDTYANLSQFFEQSGVQTKVLYDAPNREITYKVAKLNIGTPTFMRAPGETPGTFALESAMDELAQELKIDPIELRIINHTSTDPLEKLPFSLENLKECYQIGAEKFGWKNRKMLPRQTRNGKYLVGMGMATATYPAFRSSASARIQMLIDGTVKVLSATQDIGTGTYTIMAQTAADALGVPVEKIKVELGDSSLPPAPVSGGSTTAVSVTSAVLAAAGMLKKDLLTMAFADGKSKLNGRRVEEIDFADTKFFVKGDTSKSDSYADIMRRNSKVMMEACATSMPASGGGLGSSDAPCAVSQFEKDENSDNKKYSFHSFGAQFAEVLVDEDLGTIRVSRFTSVQDIGRVLNEKTARSQIIGGVIYGLGQALMEETLYDERWANPVTRTFADYHVPVNLDVPPIEVIFIGKPDLHISPIGARGIGEIGITGVAAAVANAVFNATGKRIRDLPLTPDKLL
ncbi:MAG: xanthine dehydrogenase family protein molybdopterin-binding subunit [Acidobacteriota bacterium]|nr:xanthine dehydrogenase family protein molybdopterin-binding subunit [Acidobacteriota bacterium]